MKICYFGIYTPHHTRNRVNIDGLRKNGAEVIECWTGTTGVRKYINLLNKHRLMKGGYDVMVVGFSGHAMVPLAWFLTRFPRKKLVFDAFVSAYDSNIFDRKKHFPYSLMALKYWLIDWLSCNLADLVLMDAEAHAEYISKTFYIPRRKVKGLMVGCSADIMYPRPQNKKKSDFIVHFHGTYIPTQGIPFIIKAAKLLEKENIIFNIVGKFNEYKESIDFAHQLKLKNINFFDFMPYAKLAELMADADVCLGAFGDTDKAKRTYIFKIIEAMAMKKPVITGESPALREFLIGGENVMFCKLADSKDLADKILELKNNKILGSYIAENGHLLYKQKLTPEAIGKYLLDIISNTSYE